MITLLAFKYPTVIDVDTKREIKPVRFNENSNNIQTMIKSLLFEKKFDYLLVKLDEKMYICEIVNIKKFTYSSRLIEYHPYKNVLFEENP